jgi:hypothetical protein
MTEAEFIKELTTEFRRTARNASEVATFEALPATHHKVDDAAVQVAANGRTVWIKKAHLDGATEAYQIESLIAHTCLQLRGRILGAGHYPLFNQEDLDIARCAELTRLVRESLPKEVFEETMQSLLEQVQKFTETFPAGERELSSHARLCMQRRLLQGWVKAHLKIKKEKE